MYLNNVDKHFVRWIYYEWVLIKCAKEDFETDICIAIQINLLFVGPDVSMW